MNPKAPPKVHIPRERREGGRTFRQKGIPIIEFYKDSEELESMQFSGNLSA